MFFSRNLGLLGCLLATAVLAQDPPDTYPNSNLYPLRTLWDFGKAVWPENLFVRSNGKVLISIATTPQLLSFDPSDPSIPPQVLHQFEDKTSVFAITETQQDLFYVIVNNFTVPAPHLVGVPGTSTIWEVDLRSELQVNRLADVPEAGFLDGMTTINAERGILITGDGNSHNSTTGTVYVVDTINRTVTATFSDPLLAAPANHVGIDGIRFHDGYVYFSNAGVGTFGRFQIDVNTGKNLSAIEILQSGLHPDDDFDFDSNGYAYIARSNVGIVRLSPPLYKDYEVLANVSGSTACKFGTTQGHTSMLYVTADGGVDGFETLNYTVPATLTELNLSSLI